MRKSIVILIILMTIIGMSGISFAKNINNGDGEGDNHDNGDGEGDNHDNGDGEGDNHDNGDIINPIYVEYRNNGFGGATYGTSACDRIRILMQLEQNAHTKMRLYDIYWGEYRLDSLEEMVVYCEACGFDLNKPITDGYFDWSQQLLDGNK